MKKLSYILLGAAVYATSCSGPVADPAAMNAKIDSTVNAFIESKKTELAATCDATYMQAAQDSAKVWAEKAKKGVKMPAIVKHTTKPTPTPAPTKPATSPATKADKMGGTSSNVNTAADKATKMGTTGEADKAASASKKASKMGGQ